jgi:chemotaxis protein MotB
MTNNTPALIASRSLGALISRDSLLISALIVALICSASAMIFPPLWLQRLPTALDDAVNGRSEADRAKMSNLEISLKQVQSNYEAAKDDLASGEAAVERLTMQTAVTEANLAEATAAAAQRADQITELQVALAAQQNLVQVARAEAAQRTGQVTVMGAKLAEMQRQLASRKANLQKSETQSGLGIVAAERTISALTTERDRLSVSLKAAEGESQEALVELRVAQSDAKTTVARNEALSASARAAEAEVRRLTIDLRGRERNAAALESALVGANAQADAALESLRIAEVGALTLRGRITALETDLASVQQEGGTARAEITRLQQANATAAKTAADQQTFLQSALVAAQADTARLDAALTALNGDLITAKAARAAAETRIAGLETDLVAAAFASEASLAKAVQLEANLAAAQRERQTLTGRIMEMDNQLAQAQREAITNAQAADAVTAEVKAVSQHLVTVLGSYAQAAASLGNVQTELAGLRREIDAETANFMQFKSEFFGRLNEILGDREDVLVVGDRFAFQSEVLFNSGSADLGHGGREQLRTVVSTLRNIAPDLPPDIQWILRVDGHTDAVPIASGRFLSNWELSAARSISVVRFLIEEGISPSNLSANGFGEYQPLTFGSNPVDHRKNRRIELTLTQR